MAKELNSIERFIGRHRTASYITVVVLFVLGQANAIWQFLTQALPDLAARVDKLALPDVGDVLSLFSPLLTVACLVGVLLLWRNSQVRLRVALDEARAREIPQVVPGSAAHAFAQDDLHGNPEVTAEEWTHDVIRNRTVRLGHIPQALQGLIVGKRFSGCEILGPAVIVIEGGIDLAYNKISGPADGLFWLIEPNRFAIGAVTLRDCVILNSHLHGVGMAGPPILREHLSAGLTTVASKNQSNSRSE